MSFVLPRFLPYLLNQAAEAVSRDFQSYYRDRYGMLRTEWRVLFHLGCYGDMKAGRICALASIHKTKVSRAVGALEVKRYLKRTTADHDRRVESLSLTPSGARVFRDLQKAAEDYERDISRVLSEAELHSLRDMLIRLEKGAG